MSELPDPEVRPGPGPAKSSGFHSRSERRTTRREAQRKRTAGRFLWVAAPIVAVVVVIAALLAFVVTPSVSRLTDGPSSTSTTLAAELVRSSALLVIEQDGTVVEAALVHAGPAGKIVLTVPGATLLRWTDRFVLVADLHATGDPKDLPNVLADNLGVPVGPIVTVGWSDLRESLVDAGIDPLPPAALDSDGADSAQVADALAAFVEKSTGSTGRLPWKPTLSRGDVDGFRAAVEAAVSLNTGTAWAGEALTGRVTRTGDLVYLEPDLRKAQSVLGAAEAAGR
jgi:hypothetical protein